MTASSLSNAAHKVLAETWASLVKSQEQHISQLQNEISNLKASRTVTNTSVVTAGEEEKVAMS